jgi:hypothetical protein
MDETRNNVFTTRIAGSSYYTFNYPNKGDRVILIPTPFNIHDKYAIVILNDKLQVLGHLTRMAGLNKKIGNLMNWKPFIGIVNSIYPQFNEIFIDIDIAQFQPCKRPQISLSGHIYKN